MCDTGGIRLPLSRMNTERNLETDHNLVVVAPTFNNGRTVIGIVDQALDVGGSVVVVNDGSTDDTQSLLEAWKASRPGDSIRIMQHPGNRGKAEALKTGFEVATEAGYTHALTIDTDGQHCPSRIPDFQRASESSPRSIILGERDSRHPTYPARCRFGRWLSDLATRLETGATINDTQCGFRVYPLSIFQTINCCMGRYAFEAEVLTRSVWGGAGVRNIPVECIYQDVSERVSHLHPVYDGLLGALIHFRLLGRALVPARFPSVPDPIASGDERAATSSVSRILAWFSPRALWKQIRSDPSSRSTVAMGVGLGGFIGSLPFFGFHALLALYLAKRLRLHPLTVVAGTQISMPPLSPLVIAASIWAGFVVIHFKMPVLADFMTLSISELFAEVILEWLVGSILVGTVLGVAMGLITSLALSMIPSEQPTEKSAPIVSDTG